MHPSLLLYRLQGDKRALQDQSGCMCIKLECVRERHERAKARPRKRQRYDGGRTRARKSWEGTWGTQARQHAHAREHVSQRACGETQDLVNLDDENDFGFLGINLEPFEAIHINRSERNRLSRSPCRRPN